MCFEDRFGLELRAMMSAGDCRIRADKLLKAAEATLKEADILDMQQMAKEWRELADLADWQDALQARQDTGRDDDGAALRHALRTSSE